MSPVRTIDLGLRRFASISHLSTILLIPTRFAARQCCQRAQAAASGVNRSVAPDHARGHLLCLCRRKFVVTTNSNHSRAVYPNMAREIVPSGTNQLWIPFERLHYFRDAHAGLNLNVEKANAFGSGFEVAKMRLRPRQSERACVRWRKMRRRRN